MIRGLFLGIFLLGIFLLGIFLLFAAPVAATDPMGPVAPVEPPAAEGVKTVPVPKKESPKWGRDPFAAPGSRSARTPSDIHPSPPVVSAETALSLSAIIYKEGEGAAIINDRIVRRGDSIDGMEVVEVFQDRVMLKGPSRVVELRVGRSSSKSP